MIRISEPASKHLIFERTEASYVHVTGQDQQSVVTTGNKHIQSTHKTLILS